MTTMYQTLQISHHRPSERIWKDLFKVIAVSLFFAGIAILIRNEAGRVYIMNIPVRAKALSGIGLPRGMGLRAVFLWSLSAC